MSLSEELQKDTYLHSNMVRFIIIGIAMGVPRTCLFTFQYG